jgi:hypothetical protein
MSRIKVYQYLFAVFLIIHIKNRSKTLISLTSIKINSNRTPAQAFTLALYNAWLLHSAYKGTNTQVIYYRHWSLLGLKIQRKQHQYIVNKPKALKSQTFKDFKTSVDRL